MNTKTIIAVLVTIVIGVGVSLTVNPPAAWRHGSPAAVQVVCYASDGKPLFPAQIGTADSALTSDGAVIVYGNGLRASVHATQCIAAGMSSDDVAKLAPPPAAAPPAAAPPAAAPPAAAPPAAAPPAAAPPAAAPPAAAKSDKKG